MKDLQDHGGDVPEAILGEPTFAVEHEVALHRAVETYKAQATDLHDCFVSAIAEQRRTRSA